MQRLRRIVLYSLGVLALILALLLAAPLFIDVNDFKPSIVQKLEEASGRAVAIGHIRASLFPWVGLSLSEVSIGNPPGFSEAPMLVVKEADVRLALLPLLRQQVEVKSFVLNEPHLRLERNVQGMGNWQQPAKAPSSASGRGAATEKRAATASPMWASVTAETLRVEDGVIQWQDAVKDARVELTAVHLALDQFSLDQPVHMHCTAKIAHGSLKLDARLGPLGQLAAFNAAAIPLQAHIQGEGVALGSFMSYLPSQLAGLGDATLDVNGQLEQRPDGLRLSVGTATLHRGLAYAARWRLEMAKPEQLELREVDLAIDDQPLVRINGTVRRPFAHPSYQLNVQSSELRRETVGGWLPLLHDMYDEHPQPWQRLQLAMLVSGDGQRVDVRDLQLRLDAELVRSSGSFEFGDHPRLRLRIAAEALHLDPWLPQRAKASQAGKAAIAPSVPPSAQVVGSKTRAEGARLGAAAPPARIKRREETASLTQPPLRHDEAAAGGEPDLRFLRPWRIDVGGQIETAWWHGLAMRHIRFNLAGANGSLVLDPLQLEVANGQLVERASLSLTTMPASWQEAVHIRGVRLAPVLAAFAGSDFLDGILDMQTELASRGLLPASALAKLSGRGQVMVRNGRIKGIDIPGTLRRLRLLGQETGPRSTDFSQLSGSFTIRNGVAHNDDLFMASPLFRLTGHGDVDLAAGMLDFHVKPRLVGTLVGQGDTAAVRKGLSVPLHVRGPYHALAVKPEVDVNTLMENVDAIRGTLRGGEGREAGKAIEQKIRKSLERILPGVLGP